MLLEDLIIVKSQFYVCNVICRCLCLFSFYSPSYFPLKTLRKYNKCKRLLHIYGLYYCSTNRLCRKIIIAERTILEKLWYSFLSPFCETFSLLSIYVLPLLNCFSALLKVFSIICVIRHIIWRQFHFSYLETRIVAIHNYDRFQNSQSL